MGGPLNRSAATWWLLGLTAALTAPVALSATTSVAIAAGWRAVDADADTRADAALFGVYGDASLRIMEGYVAVVTVPAAVVGVLLLVGLATWRAWAREAAFGVFGLLGALLVLLALVSLSGPSRSGGAGLLAGIGLLVAAALAVSTPVCEDFDRKRIAAEVQERRRLQEQRRRRSEAT